MNSLPTHDVLIQLYRSSIVLYKGDEYCLWEDFDSLWFIEQNIWRQAEELRLSLGLPLPLRRIFADIHFLEDPWVILDLLIPKAAKREQHLFACDCAERALRREQEKGREPDVRSWAVVDKVRLFANGQVSSHNLSAFKKAALAAKNEAELVQDQTESVLMAAKAALSTSYLGGAQAASNAAYYTAETLRHAPDVADLLEAELAWFHEEILRRIEDNLEK